MYQIRFREFTAPNGVKRTFWFRDDTNDESCIIACFEQDYYKILSMGLKAGDVAIDLGAHIGGVTFLLTAIPGVKVIAVECIPENVALLKKNQAEQNTEVKIYDKAIWQVLNEEIPIYYGNESTESGRVHKFVGNQNKDKDAQFYSVKTITLKQILEENNISECKLLKLDVEGAEQNLFNTMFWKDLSRFEIITGEYHNKDFDDFFPFRWLYEIEQGPDGYFICGRKNAIK